jgi:NADH-quinone oxidoreductase subunit H
MILMSSTIVIIFFGGWLSPFWLIDWLPEELIFTIKILIFCYFFIFVRANLPRYRYDQLMYIGWKVFLPITLVYFLFTVFVVTLHKDFWPFFNHKLPTQYTNLIFLC